MRLSDDELAQFRHDGYLLLPSVFDADEIGRMAEAADAVLAFVIESCRRLGAASPRLDAGRVDGAVHVRKIQPINDVSRSLAGVSADERLVGPLRQIMGEEPVLMEEKLNLKQVMPGNGLEQVNLPSADDSFPLHHDYGYFVLEGYPPETLSSAISIDDCAGRGPIRVVPGSHLVEYQARRPGDGVVEADVPLADRVDVDAPAGSVMLFHSKLLHDSTPNDSGLPRRVMIYSHFPASHGGDPDRRNRPLRVASQEFERRAGVVPPG